MRDLLLNHFSIQRPYRSSSYRSKHKSENAAIIHKSSVSFIGEILMRARCWIVRSVNINSLSALRLRELLVRRRKRLEFDQFPFTTRHSNLFFSQLFALVWFDLVKLWAQIYKNKTKTSPSSLRRAIVRWKEGKESQIILLALLWTPIECGSVRLLISLFAALEESKTNAELIALLSRTTRFVFWL